MSIAQRKDGRWCVKFKVDGKWKQRTFRTRREARTFDAEGNLEDEINGGGALTVGELAVAFLRSTHHHQGHINLIKRNLFMQKSKRSNDPCGDANFLFHKLCDSVTRRDLEMLRENMRVRGLMNSTINRATASIKAILNWGVEQELITRNPWKDYGLLPVRRRPVHVSMDSLRAVYAHCRPWMQWAIKTAFCLCLRPGIKELFGLKWNSFDFSRGVVTIIQGKSGIPKTVIPPMPYMIEAQAKHEEAKAKGIELVCPNWRGGQVRGYGGSWRKACRLAGVKMRPYDIRHLAATQMLAAGADIVSVAAQLGHQNCAMTGAVYAHVVSSAQRKAAQALEFV